MPDDLTIPVLRPLLPQASMLLPYLQRIDATRIYSNWGPLVLELSERLCGLFSIPQGGVICASSGMSALVGAILASAGMAGTLRSVALVPDFTFTATALAAQMCGYRVALADCDRESWAMSADQLLAKPGLLDNVGVVIPVAPFGRACNLAQWQRFQALTGIPVVIDAAACFEHLLSARDFEPASIPLVLSFHATKSFATGEGGCVVTRDHDLALSIGQYLNFGFSGSRNSEVPGINGKMSEYVAAIGLAELDHWEAKRSGFQRVFETYRRCLQAEDVPNRLWGPPEISSSYLLLECESAAQASSLMDTLAQKDIHTRLWYGRGLSEHAIFSQASRIEVHGMLALVPETLVGLPVAVDMSESQIQRVVRTIKLALA